MILSYICKFFYNNLRKPEKINDNNDSLAYEKVIKINEKSKG